MIAAVSTRLVNMDVLSIADTESQILFEYDKVMGDTF